ncbi:MAG TPA: PilZ domain-containing protein [Phycisphaerae bacterium]|nr:PilZ domain-containing protein [Phycisphaerae bacterium]
MSLDAISARARQFKRHAARWSARIEAHGDHAEQFRLSFADQFNDLAVVDVSEGGFGLVTSFLVPKNLKLIVHVDAAVDGGRTFLIRGIIRRCMLLDHRPCYQVGVQFIDASGADERELVKLAKKTQPQAATLVGAEAS